MCHAYSIDGRCPETCGEPGSEVLALQGTFYGYSPSFPSCLQTWTFAGSTFSSTVLQLDPARDAPVSSEGYVASCPGSHDGGRRWGTFTMDVSAYPAQLSLVYTDGTAGPLPRLATVSTVRNGFRRSLSARWHRLAMNAPRTAARSRLLPAASRAMRNAAIAYMASPSPRSRREPC